ncbi:MAG: potassium transporter TrkA [Epsilonproteobacteria bacterium]|nr:potassium transporter TrkA [Campylobacterota bacterium]
MNKLVKLLVDFSFFLEESKRYNKIKKFFKNLLENHNYKYSKYFNYLMIFLIISSVVIIIDEVKHPISKWLLFYDAYVVTLFFIIEYILRLWVYNDIHKIIIEEFQSSIFLEKKFKFYDAFKKIILKKIEYIISPMAIIDLFAILPSFRELRILRIFVLFRAFKLLRYSSHISHFMQVIVLKKSELFMLLLLFVFIVFLSGVSIYVFEEQINPHINTLYDAFYWSIVTITSVGYGDIVPISSEGRSVATIIILVGIGLISFATSIIVSAFGEKSEELKNEKVKATINGFSKYYLICGYSHLAELVASRLKNSGDNFVIIDNDEKKIEQATKDGYLAYRADASSKNVLLDLDINKKVLSVITLAQDDMQNIFISLSVRSISKNVVLISRMRYKHSYKKLKLAGVDKIISAANMASMLVGTLVNKPIATEAINSILSGKRNARCDQVEVLHNSFLEGKSIADVDISSYKLILLGVSRRNSDNTREFIFNPQDDFILREGDILVVLGYTISIAHFKSIIEKSSIKYARKQR